MTTSIINILFLASEMWLATKLYKSVKQFGIEKSKYRPVDINPLSSTLNPPSNSIPTRYQPLKCNEEGTCEMSQLCPKVFTGASQIPTDDPLTIYRYQLTPGENNEMFRHGCYTYKPQWSKNNTIILGWYVSPLSEPNAFTFLNGENAEGRVVIIE